MPWEGLERRRCKRYGVKGSTIQYKSARLFGLFSNNSERYLILNISVGGLHFITKEELKENRKLLLNIHAPFLGDGVIRARGRVIWIKKSTELMAYRVGIEFSRMSKRDQTKLKLLLDNTVLDKIDLSTRMYLREVEKL